MSISSKLLQVNQVKQDIKDAIEDKGIDMTDTTFTDYADKIDIIPVQKEEEEKTVSTTSFASGNIVVEPTTNKVMTKVTINKDTTNHIGENIKDGITLYGIQGSLLPAKEEETKTISNADFSSGNLVINPTGNKVMTKVTINKDTNLTTKNIKDGVTLFGVTGDYEGEGGRLVENYAFGFTDTNLVVIAIAIYCAGGVGGNGYLGIQGSKYSDGTNPTTLRFMSSWSDIGWKFFYIFVNKSQYRYIQIGAPRYISQYIKLTRYNLGIKETYTEYSWIDLNNVRGMLFEFQAY